jgi:hypothetical protein
MKRITLILILIIGFGNVNNAQSTKSEPKPHLRLGIKLGIGTARDGSLVVLEPNSYTYKPSFSGGLVLIYPFKKNISLELDALYSYKGVGFRLVNALPDVYASKTSHNLEVPLLLNFVLDKNDKFFLQAGLHLQAQLSQSSTVVSDDDKKAIEVFMRQPYNPAFYNAVYYNTGVVLPSIVGGEVGLILGILYKPKSKFGIDIRYVGMTKYEYTERSFMLSGNYYF